MCYIYNMKGIRGQSVVEYILLVVAVVTVLIVFLSPQGPYKKSLEKSFFNATINQIKKNTSQIKF